MSSQDKEDLLNVTYMEEEGMDTDILDSSSHDDGEQDQEVDETTPEQESTPKEHSQTDDDDWC
jgi:hypothetical protein